MKSKIACAMTILIIVVFVKYSVAESGGDLIQYPSWPIPETLRVVELDPNDEYTLITLAALQGLVNRQAPEGNMVYLEMDGFPDRFWRRYYVSKLGLGVVKNTVEELLAWARTAAGIEYYIIIDPTSSLHDIEAVHFCTINFATTMAGIFGNALPVHPDDVPLLEKYGYTLLPDSYRDRLGREGAKLRVPNAFDLRNQWRSQNPDAPWRTREDAYRWALDALLPLTDHHGVTMNRDLPNRKGDLGGYAPWINDYSVGTKLFHFYFDPNPEPGRAFFKTDYDLAFYRELLERSGPFTMVRGWAGDEAANLRLISQMHCYHAGSKQMANASVHAAVSQLFEEPFIQRTVAPEAVELDPEKIYLTFSFTDGDQFGVVYRFYQHPSDPLWKSRIRGQIPINWTMNGLMYHFGRGIMRWFFDNASPKDYFTADLPVGYAWFMYEYFGEDLDDYDVFANSYMVKSGMPVADYLPGYGSFPAISSRTIESHVKNLSDVIAIREGYAAGNFYQGIFWPEDRPLMPYIRNTYAAGLIESTGKQEPPEEIASVIKRIAERIPWRPLFMHLTWVNWFTTPEEMHQCINLLNQDYSNRYQLVGMPEFIALAQKAKLTGQYPMEFYPHHRGDRGLESPYLWEERGTTTNSRDEISHPWRATSGRGYVTYKFNVAPSKSARVIVEIAGKAYRMDVSSDNQTWTEGLIRGQSRERVTESADLTPYLNSKGSVYIKFTGETKLWHVKVDYE